jgi:ABC-type nitrate/sulfonate/bicarbonate transport system substrate-binding protein
MKKRWVVISIACLLTVEVMGEIRIEAAELPVVRIGCGIGIQNAPWYIGVEKGIFLKNGVDVKVKQFNSGSEIQTALKAGELEMGDASFDVHIVSETKDTRYKAFSLNVNDATKVFPDDMYAIILKPNSNISRIEDLRGKKIGTTAGTTQDTWVRAVLTKAGVALDAVTFLNAQPTHMPAAFSGGGVDAVVTNEPNGEMIMSRHSNAKVLLRGGGYVGQRTVTCTTDEYLNSKRSTTGKVAAGLVEAKYMTRTQRQVVAEVVPHWIPGVDGSLAMKAISHISFDPRMSPLVKEGWSSHAKLMVDQKKIKQAPPFEPAFDMLFLEEVGKYPQWLKDLRPVP